ncbi:PEP/pyruvate-binding domain-containing protein [Streptococcus pneumoniae]|nr:PEP/pyruvate-binding domain-containing protein [Streptococcus pneumoniae]
MNIELIEYSKAEVLEYLNAQNPKKFKLPKQYILSYSNYYSEGIKGIIESPLFKINKFAVRSSCKFEDQDNESNAGKYESYLNVEKVHLTDAIDKVFSSYEFYDDINQVLVQEMVSNVSMSGVVFTKDPNHGGDFFVVNYDNTTEETDTVTSGKNSGSNIYVLHRKAIYSIVK